MPYNQLSRGDSNLKKVSKVRPPEVEERGSKLTITVYADRQLLILWNAFKETAKKKHGNKKNWLVSALKEALAYYLEKAKVEERDLEIVEEKIKMRSDVKNKIESFFATVLSHYKTLQPGLTKKLVFYFLDLVGVEGRASKYRYLKRMCSIGMLKYSGLSLGEPLYRIDWEVVKRIFPQIFEDGLKKSL